VICRDRSGVYSDRSTRGAPHAVQVADRWHLWHNLAEAVERAVSRHREQLPTAVQAQGPPAAPPRGPAPLELPRAGRVAGRTRHADVHRLLAEGRNLAQDARELGLSCGTVRRFARAASPEELLVNDGASRQANIDLDQRFAGCNHHWRCFRG
jgi:hypothetical protein